MGFAETGIVNDEWDLDELHSDMKWTLGGGVRLMVEGVIVRIDIGFNQLTSHANILLLSLLNN